MLRYSMWLAGGSLMLGSVATEVIGREQPAQIQNYNAPGNLESNYNLGCIGLNDVKPEYNPVDLFKAMKVCILAKRYDDAVRLFAIAGTYGRYDSLRVADATSHQAITVARMEIFGDLPEATSKEYDQAASTFLSNSTKIAEICVEAKRIGPPTYFPRYMIQHGMGAFFRGNGDGLVQKFDSKTAWNQALASYLKCAAS